jgi:hypothetical protein
VQLAFDCGFSEENALATVTDDAPREPHFNLQLGSDVVAFSILLGPIRYGADSRFYHSGHEEETLCDNCILMGA